MCVCRETENGIASSADGNQSRYQIYNKKEERFKQLLGSLKSTSAKEDFIRTLR